MIDNQKTIANHKLSVLNTQLDKQIEGFKTRRVHNQRRASLFKALTIIFGFGITVLLGLDVEQTLKSVFANIALILGGLVTLITSWDAFINYRSFWFRYTVTYTQLLALRSEIEYKYKDDMGTMSETEIDKLYRKFQDILEETNEFWRDLRKQESNKSS